MILQSRFPDVEIPDLPLHQYVLAGVDRWSDAPALIDGPTGRALTYGALRALVDRVAGALAARGVKQGDRVCIYAPNIPEYAAVFLGVSRLGAVNTTANPTYLAEELSRQLRDSGARHLFTVSALLDRARAAVDAAGGGEVIVLDSAPVCVSLAELVANAPPPPTVHIDPGVDLVALPYSSGTTGLPKGVMLTHRNLVANIAQCEAHDAARPGDRTIAALPFFHIYGLVVVLCLGLRRGGCLVTMPRFDLEQYLRLSAEHRVRQAYIVPPIALALARHPAVANHDLSPIEFITCGAAPMGRELERALAARLDCTVKQGYGMTEASPVTHFTPSDPALTRSGSCGLLVANTECRVVDIQTRADVPVGAHGELLIRGPQVMNGYLNHDDATGDAIDTDGWLRTGDVGYADADGYYFIVDRLKEFIKYKGFQIAPAELEGILLSHPSVADAAVIPVADEEAGEVPKAYVVKKQEVSADDLMAFVAESVAPFKKIRAVEFTDQIPKSPSGKILRRELIARERAR